MYRLELRDMLCPHRAGIHYPQTSRASAADLQQYQAVSIPDSPRALANLSQVLSANVRCGCDCSGFIEKSQPPFRNARPDPFVRDTVFLAVRPNTLDEKKRDPR